VSTNLEELVNPIIKAERKRGRAEREAYSDPKEQLPHGTQVFSAFLSQNKRLLLPTGEIIARFKEGASADIIEDEVKKSGGEIVRSVSYMPNGFVIRPVDGGDGVSVANLLTESKADIIDFAHPNFMQEIPYRSMNPSMTCFQKNGT